MADRIAGVEASIKVIAQYVKEQTDRMEKEIAAIKAQPSEEPLNSSLKEELEQIKAKITALPPTRDENVKTNIEPRLQFLERKLEKVQASVDANIGLDVGELKRHMDRLDRNVSETLAIKKELDDTEKTLNSMKGLANRLKDFDADNYRKEFNKHLDEMLGQVRSLETSDIKNLAGKMEHFGNLEAEDMKNLNVLLRQFRGMEEEDIKKVNDSMKKLKDLEINEINEFSKQIQESKAIVEEEAVVRLAFEKRMMELEAKVEQLNAAESKLNQTEINDVKKLVEELGTAKETLEDESISRISLDKRLHELEVSMGHMRDVVKGVENIETLDITKLQSRINEMESNMKMASLKMLTQQLNDFAKSMDKRLPNVVSREEYIRQMADVQQRLRGIEAPDLSPLGARVDRLEKKIEEIANMMRGVYNRIPIVVE